MWRWWILAGVVVTALGVVACRDAGRLEENPCAHEDPDDDLWGGGVPIEGDLRLSYVARVDVDFGKTARLVLSLRNPQPYVQAIVRNDNMDFVVTTPECELVWWSRDITPRAVSGTVQLRFDPKRRRASRRMGPNGQLGRDGISRRLSGPCPHEHAGAVFGAFPLPDSAPRTQGRPCGVRARAHRGGTTPLRAARAHRHLGTRPRRAASPRTKPVSFGRCTNTGRSFGGMGMKPPARICWTRTGCPPRRGEYASSLHGPRWIWMR